MIQTVVKRDGRIVGFNEEKIVAAIRKAMLRTDEGEDEHLAEAPHDVVPPQEGDVLVQGAEDQACKGEDGHEDGREHHEMETAAHPAGLEVRLHPEGIVQETESDEERRNQDDVQKLRFIGFSNAKS